jgi:hypothetical protein
MKKILFSILFIAGIFISSSSHATTAFYGHGGYGRYGRHGGYAVRGGYYHGGYGYIRPGIYYRPVPAPYVYGSAYPVAYGYYPPYYGGPVYPYPRFHRHYCRRW